jgi:hypothetical protein
VDRGAVKKRIIFVPARLEKTRVTVDERGADEMAKENTSRAFLLAVSKSMMCITVDKQ